MHSLAVSQPVVTASNQSSAPLATTNTTTTILVAPSGAILSTSSNALGASPSGGVNPSATSILGGTVLKTATIATARLVSGVGGAATLGADLLGKGTIKIKTESSDQASSGSPFLPGAIYTASGIGASSILGKSVLATVTRAGNGANFAGSANTIVSLSNNINNNVSSFGKPCLSVSSGTHSTLISAQPLDGIHGELYLTEEEKKTLISEGYPIPTKLPLTKAEEKSLKKIRRKIKNKISAQESRRKKKEFVDTLELKVSQAAAEVDVYKKRCELLQKQNETLQAQVLHLRNILVNCTDGVAAASGDSGKSAQPVRDIKEEVLDDDANVKFEPACYDEADGLTTSGLDLD